MKKLISIILVITLIFATVPQIFLVGANDTENLAGDMDGDGMVNTTDLAMLKLYLAGSDVSNTSKCEYTIERVDRSYKKSGKVVIEHYYDLVQLKGSSQAVANINSALKAEMNSFFLSDNELKEYAEFYYNEAFCYTGEAQIGHNDDGYISVFMNCEWYMGGVFNTDYYGYTYNLSTGKSATLTELTGKDRSALVKELKNMVINTVYREWGTDVSSDINNYTLEDFDFCIDDGEIVLLFQSYEIASDGVAIYTGMHIN